MRTESEPYHRPEAPGYVGAINRRALAAAVSGIVLSNTLTTQAMAWYFSYHPALRHALFHVGRTVVYLPFAWLLWQFEYSGEDPKVRMVLSFGTLSVLLCGMVLFGVVSAMNMARTKRLSRGMEHLHGSARWAQHRDIESAGLLTAEGEGVYVGGWHERVSLGRWRHANRVHYLRHNGPEHVLAFAPTRSGKGVGLVIPTLLTWNQSAVIYDIKGENWAKTAGWRASQGHVCFKFSPTEDGGSSRFNPLTEIRLFTGRDVSDAQNFAEMLIRGGGESPSERYWEDAAVSITTGVILHVCYGAAAKGTVAPLSDIAACFTNPGKSFEDTLNDLLTYPHDVQKKAGWRDSQGKLSHTHPTVARKAREMLDKADKDRSGVLSTAQTALAVLADPIVAANTAASDFRVAHLVNFERPISLYLVVPPSDKIRLRPIIRLMFTVIVNRLTEKLDFAGGTEAVTNKQQLLFMIDEFPSLNKMALFEDALSYMAGYGLKAYLIAQDIEQIVKAYGEHHGVVSNCHIRVSYAPNTLKTAELLSRMTGTQTIQHATHSFSGKRTAPLLSNVNTSLANVERPLLTPDEIMRIKPPKKIGAAQTERIISPGDMLIFVGGQHAIYGRQILYFTDPELASRAKLAPPTERYLLDTGDSGGVHWQPSEALTAAVVSRVEQVQNVQDMLDLSAADEQVSQPVPSDFY